MRTHRLISWLALVALRAAATIPALAGWHRCVEGCAHCAAGPAAAAEPGDCCCAHAEAVAGPAIGVACACGCGAAADPAPIAEPATRAASPDPACGFAPEIPCGAPHGAPAQVCRPAARAPPPAGASTTVLRR